MDSLDAATCPRCHGAGTVMARVCCGRGCVNCVGEGLTRQIECRRCGGTGRQRPSLGAHPPSTGEKQRS